MKKFFTSERLLSHIYITFYFVLISTSSIAQWVQRSNGFKPRSEVNSVVYNNKIYAFFGFNDAALKVVEPSAEVYDPATNTWKLLASVPSNKAVTHAAAVVIDDKVWHIGGRVGKNPGPLTSEIWIYNITSNSWSPGPQLIDPATKKPILWAAGGAALLGRTLHVFGGLIMNACNNTTTGSGDQAKYHLTLNVDDWLANPSQPAPWKNVLPPMPVKRNHLSTVVLGGKIYAIGGQFDHDCYGAVDKQYAHVYDPATNTWAALPSLPTPRSHTEGSVFAIDGKIYVAGGQAKSGASTNKVTIFDPAANNGAGAWYEDTNLTLPYNYETVSAKVIDNTFIISHGGKPRFDNATSTTYSRTISRTPVYNLGFNAPCADLQMASGRTVRTKTLLFTIYSSKTYTTSSDASWLKVVKNASGTATKNAVDIEVEVNTTGLAPGTYRGTITASGTGIGPNYKAAKYCVNLTVVSTNTNTLEAEKANLNKVVVASNHQGFTGTGFADYQNPAGDFIEWTVNKASSGSVALKFRYANASSYNRPLKLEVNGVVKASSLAFPSTGAWNKWSTVSITTNLVAGINKIKLTAIGSSGANIDNLEWSDVVTSSSTASTETQNNITMDATTSFKASVAPNPASGIAKLTLNRLSGAPVEITIANASGSVYKKIPARDMSTGQYEFSVRGLPSGLYIIIVKQGSEQTSAKLVVSNN
jgi:N-acetylneuraminic acid mutarotase